MRLWRVGKPISSSSVRADDRSENSKVESGPGPAEQGNPLGHLLAQDVKVGCNYI